MTFQEMVAEELALAREHFPAFHSAHEGYAVIAEEVDELWDWVKQKEGRRCKGDAIDECVQIAAMAQRFAEDLLKE